MNKTYNIKKILIACIFTILVIVCFVKLYGYFNSATIEVSTDSAENYIKIERITTGESFSIQRQANKMRERVKPGVYTVSVFNKEGVSGQAKTISVDSREIHNVS